MDTHYMDKKIYSKEIIARTSHWVDGHTKRAPRNYSGDSLKRMHLQTLFQRSGACT